MHHLPLLTAMTAFAASSFAAPTSEAEVIKGFTVNQVATGKRLFKNGPLEMQKTYLKYSKAVPANVAVAASAAVAVQSGTVTATPESYDASYLCPVSVGTPAQTLNLDFDTGSSDLWVFSSELSSSESSGHTIYTSSKSTSAEVDSGETWDISYGDGSGAAGNVYYDKVVVGAVTATSQAVEAATSVSSELTEDTDNDGLLGLGWPNINTCSPDLCTPFFQSVESTLPSKLFTADLKYHAAGSYDFGFINTAKYTGSITYTSVTTSSGYWEFTAGGYTVGTASAVSSSFTAIADTGTTLIYVPAAAAKAYWATVSGSSDSTSAGGYIFPCSATLPSFSVTISGVSHTVPGTYINYAPYSGSTCFGGIQSDAGIGFAILGDIFLKSQFIVFDVGNTRLGIAAQ